MPMNVFDRTNRKKDLLENNKGRDLGINHSSKWRCTKWTNESYLQMPLIQRILKWPVESMATNGTEEWLMTSNAIDSTNLKMIHSNDNRGRRDHWWRQDKLRLTVCDTGRWHSDRGEDERIRHARMSLTEQILKGSILSLTEDRTEEESHASECQWQNETENHPFDERQRRSDPSKRICSLNDRG